jgi:hypothetical protein
VDRLDRHWAVDGTPPCGRATGFSGRPMHLGRRHTRGIPSARSILGSRGGPQSVAGGCTSGLEAGSNGSQVAVLGYERVSSTQEENAADLNATSVHLSARLPPWTERIT